MAGETGWKNSCTAAMTFLLDWSKKICTEARIVTTTQICFSCYNKKLTIEVEWWAEHGCAGVLGPPHHAVLGSAARHTWQTNRIKMAVRKVVLGLLCKEEISSPGIKKDTAQSTYIEYHSVCPLVGIGTLPPPLSPASVPLPPEPGGGAHSPAGEGLGESQFRRLEKKLSTLCLLCGTQYHFLPNVTYSPSPAADAHRAR
jgi:hypothetical protein